MPESLPAGSAAGARGSGRQEGRYRIEAVAGEFAAAEAAVAALRAQGLDASVRHASSLPALGEPGDGEDIVAVGMGMVVPGASSPEQFWHLLRDRVPQFSEPGERMDIDSLWSADPASPDKTYTRTSGFIRDLELHPQLREELASDRWRGTEISGQWLRHSLLQALDGVRFDAELRAFVAVGMTADGGHAAEHSLLRHGARLLGGADEDFLAGLYPGGDPDLDATAPYRVVREALAGFPEPVETQVVDTACSSSLYSFDFGMRALREGRADIALCGGTYAVNAQTMVLFSKLDGLARSGRVRSLDRSADGVLFSDGAAVVALKTYARATADGDPILGFVRGFGGSSDGRGKAVYAPNPAGQRIALERAWNAAGITPEEIDWVVAHATGTAAGDAAELQALAAAAPAKKWTLTSNKSLIGHTGWAAGAVNVIHALLALRNEAIPAQHLYTEPVSDTVRIPERTLPWAANGAGRTAAVSAMGFGGTNGHLVLSDRPRPPAPRPEEGREPIVVVASTAFEPDSGSGFGEHFPAPAPLDVRLPPTVLARMDRSQLMALRCALDLRGEWSKDPALLERGGVFVGHTGQVWQALACTLRAYADDITARSGRTDLGDFTAAVRALTPESNSDSLPGLMPNIMASRVAQLLDLHGPNMTLDAGADSSHAALATACRYLASGELESAIVIGANPCAELIPAPEGRAVTEAVAGVVLMRRSAAEARGLDVLGELSLAGSQGPPEPAEKRYFHAAEGLMQLHRAIRTAEAPDVLMPAGPGTPAIFYTPAKPAPEGETAAELGELRHHVMRLQPGEQPAVRQAVPALGADTLVLTNVPGRLAEVPLPEGCIGGAPSGPGPAGALVIADPQELAGALAGRLIRHVRVLFDATGPDALELQDLAFAAAQHCADAMEDGGSFAVLALDAMIPAAGPATGLFVGLVRALTADLPGALVYGVVADAADLDMGLALLSRESATERHLAVAYYRHGVRLEAVLSASADDRPRRSLPEEPLIVATGGGRGITVELVDQLAGLSRPAGIWLLGSGPAAGPEVLGELPAERPAALRQLMAEHPGEKIAALNQRYNRRQQTVARARSIERLAARFGPDKVHYRQCDVRDAEAVRRIAAEIAEAGGADIVVHGAGIERASALRRKPLAEFQQVRDVKVRGYLNLRAAFDGHNPELWLAISSVTTVVPRPGEADYISANEYLIHAAAHARAAEGADAHALISGLWAESGMVTHTQVQDAYLAREDNFTHLDDELGRRYFRTEIERRRPDALSSVWLGETEWRMLGAIAPGLRAAGVRTEPLGAFVRGEPQKTEEGAALWEFDIGLDAHPYLLDHQVDGRPTLPGTFIMEIAAEAATALGEGRPVAITDAVFSRFIRAAEEQWPRRLMVSARSDGDQVEVVVSSPRRGPVPAQEYSRMTVLLSSSYGTAGAPLGLRPEAAPALDPYALPGSPVRLGGIFDSLREQRTSPDDGSARLRLPPSAELRPLQEFRWPALAMDSLLRATAASSASEEEAAVPVPVRLERFDLYVSENDAGLAETAASVGLRYRQAEEGRPSRCEAVDAAGRVLFAFTGLTTRDKRAALRLSEAGGATR